MQERRHSQRRNFGYYMPITDDSNQQLVGHLADISLGGFKLDSTVPVKEDKVYQLRLALTDEIASKPFMHFVARSKWCTPDEIQPSMFYVGFEISRISDQDAEIFKRIYQKYGA